MLLTLLCLSQELEARVEELVEKEMYKEAAAVQKNVCFSTDLSLYLHYLYLSPHCRHSDREPYGREE